MFKGSIPIVLASIDIGKSLNVFCVYDAQELSPQMEPMTVITWKSGFEEVAAKLREYLSQSPVRLGMEPTGVYSENWGRAIQERFSEEISAGRLEFRLVNPHQVKLARQQLQRGRARKTDAIDTQAIASCLQVKEGQAARFDTVEETRFRLWASRSRQLGEAKSRLKIEVGTQVDRFWPGALVNVKRFKNAYPRLTPPRPLVETRPLERKTVQIILTYQPNPYRIREMGDVEIQSFLRQHGGRAGQKTVSRIRQCAEEALLPPPEVMDLYLAHFKPTWQQYLALKQQEQALEAQAQAWFGEGDSALLATIPGITLYMAARYIAAIRSVDRFDHADRIWAYAGFDPRLYQSGNTRRLGHLSKRGQPDLRDTLFQMGTLARHHAPHFRAVYQRVLPRFGAKGKVGATIHVTRKLNRVMFQMLKTQTPYNEAYLR